MKTLFLSVALFISIFTSMSTEETPNSVSTETSTDVPDYIIINNADVGIFPGGSSDQGKTFISKNEISPIAVDLVVTGIKSATDGTELVIYATTGNIILLPNHPDSTNGNRIEQSSVMTIAPGEALELTYSTNSGKWIITGSL